MKKYVKPVLIYESFAMAQQIAACDFDSNNTNEDIYSCVFTNDEGWEVFSSGICASTGDAYCEHASAETSISIFNS